MAFFPLHFDSRQLKEKKRERRGDKRHERETRQKRSDQTQPLRGALPRRKERETQSEATRDEAALHLRASHYAKIAILFSEGKSRTRPKALLHSEREREKGKER